MLRKTLQNKNILNRGFCNLQNRAKHTLPEVPYLEQGLGPCISPKTLSFHYGKHHQTYVNNLNNLVEGTALDGKSLEELITDPNILSDPTKQGLFNNAAQVWNHSFFWESMTPNGNELTDPELISMLEVNFGSVEEFQKKFTQNAVANFGSGWTWLVERAGNLDIVNTSNAMTPIADRPGSELQRPLLTCDVWEHSYYLDHQNRRPDYVNSFWKVVDWNAVASRLKQ